MKLKFAAVLFIVQFVFIGACSNPKGELLGDIDVEKGEVIEASPAQKALLIVPHPDDEILGFTSVFLNYDSVHVVLVTCGERANTALYTWANCASPTGDLSAEEIDQLDPFRQEFCETRVSETNQALSLYSIDPPKVLSYPTGQLQEIWENGQAVNYQGDELKKESLISELVNEIQSFSPDIIFTTDELDTHSDHSSLFYFVDEAVQRTDSCRINTSIIHSSEGKNGWPHPKCYKDPLLSCSELRLKRKLLDEPLEIPIEWEDLSSFIVPLNELEVLKKLEAISLFKSQIGETCRNGETLPLEDLYCLDRYGYMWSFARTNEIFRSWDYCQ